MELKADGQKAPLGTGPKPWLTWRNASQTRGAGQTAWQVLVASAPDLLKPEAADLWDSDRQPATRDLGAQYKGRPLASGQVAYWTVRVWDASGAAGAWASPERFEVAPSKPADWHGARWIGDGKPLPTTDEDFYKDDPAPLMRGEFALDKPIRRARLHVTGLGWALTSINGAMAGDGPLDPPWTKFDRRVFFRSLDVTKQLKEGKNCLGIALGNGWYNPMPLRMWGGRNIRDSVPLGRPRAIALLEVEHTDGTTTRVTTDGTWQASQGPVLFNSVYLGERRDARQERPGWDTPGHSSEGWSKVAVVDAPLEPLQPLSMPPTTTGPAIPAVAITSPSPGVHIVDFGKNFSGVPEMKLNLPAGTRLVARYGELLQPDGQLNPLTSVCGQIKGKRKRDDGTEKLIGGPGAPEVAWQQDVYITRGGGEETWRPHFTFHAFRFMELTGLPSAPNLADIQAFPTHTDVADVGSFHCSDKLLNDIQRICRQTFHSNLVGVQSDCPHRERFGYGGDIVATSDTFLMNFDMSGFYAKTVRDWSDAARPDGRFTDTAPFVGIDYCGVGWAMVHPLLVEQLYQYHGDRRLLEEQYPAALKWLEGVAAKRVSDLIEGGLGDHEALVKLRGPVLTTPMFIDSARRIARFARVLGKTDDAARVEAMANESVTAWSKAFLDPATGKVGDGNQTELVFALALNTVDESMRPKVVEQLVAALAAEDGPSLTTGIFGTKFLLDELSEANRSDLAFALATRKTFPSWGWMLANDATTLWEHWAGSDNTFSHNHPMFGSISGWFFRWLGGIQAAPDAVAFDRIFLRPQTPKGLETVDSSHRSPRGEIGSRWKQSEGETEFVFSIPSDTKAIIELPARPGDVVTEGGKSPEVSAGLKVLGTTATHHRFEAGSGTYQFVVKHAPSK